MSNVISLMPEEASADDVLESCKGDYSAVLVLGWSADELLQAKSTQSLDIKEIVYMVELFKQAVLTAGYVIDE